MTVLGLFSAAEPELGVTDIARRLNMSKSTVARILYTLELSGVLLFIEDKQKYRLGYKVVEMSSIFLNTCTIRKVALPYMRELRKKIDETIDLSVLHRNKRILIERSHGYYDVIQRDIPGKPTMLHASASGKLFLAYMPVQERDRIIDDMDLVKFTSKTITNRE